MSSEEAVVSAYGERVIATLRDFLAFAEEAQAVVVREGRDAFFRSRALQLAAEALLQKLGEAVNRLPSEFRDDHPEVSWRPIRGMRNIVTHEYDQIDYELVWTALTVSLPKDVNAVQAIVDG